MPKRDKHTDVRKTIIQNATVQNSVSKFCKLCEYVNLDVLSPTALHVVWIIMSKFSEDPEKEFGLFVDEVNRVEIERDPGDVQRTVEWQRVRDDFSFLGKIISHNTDFLNLMRNFQIAQEGCFAALLQNNCVCATVRRCMNEAQLGTLMAMDERAVLWVLLCITPSNVQTAKMLERTVCRIYEASGTPVPLDVEMRCLKCLSFIQDVKMQQNTVQDALVKVLACCTVTDDFKKTLSVKCLTKAAPETSCKHLILPHMQKPATQIRLRDVIHDKKYSETKIMASFESWVTQQKFPISTSARLQQLLYFMRVQVDVVAHSIYAKYFPPALIEKVARSSVDEIDASAVIKTLHVIRICRHNVKRLVDFRVQCLNNFCASIREKLSLTQVLQLYIACYQHTTIREKCWRSIVNSWNYSMLNALDNFIRENPFEIEAVVDSIVYCIQKDGPA